jgi:pimeloyl-ACP methyl ester carboxylesterase
MGGRLSSEETFERWERLLADGDRDSVTREFLRDIAGYAEADIARLEQTPLWDARRRIVPTLPRELRAERLHSFDEWALGDLDIPTLLLVGSDSPPWAVDSVDAHTNVIRNAEKRVLQGQGHGANLTAPELLVAELTRFFATGSDVSREP